MFFTLLKLYKWYQIVQRITNKCRGESKDNKPPIETHPSISAKCPLRSPLYFQFQIHSPTTTEDVQKRGSSPISATLLYHRKACKPLYLVFIIGWINFQEKPHQQMLCLEDFTEAKVCFYFLFGFTCIIHLVQIVKMLLS